MRRMPLNATDIEKFEFISYNFEFSDDKKLEIPLVGNYQNNIYYKMFLKFQEGSIQNIPALIFDESSGLYFGMINDPNVNDFYLVNGKTSQVVDINMYIENNILKVIISHTTEELLSEDNVKTIFGHNITGTGDITMYRHQITIRFDIDTKEVHCVVYSSSKAQIIDYDNFIAVAKPISNFNYPAIYVNGNNAEPAFIRFESNTILVGLSTGMERFTGVSDNVSPI